MLNTLHIVKELNTHISRFFHFSSIHNWTTHYNQFQECQKSGNYNLCSASIKDTIKVQSAITLYLTSSYSSFESHLKRKFLFLKDWWYLKCWPRRVTHKYIYGSYFSRVSLNLPHVFLGNFAVCMIKDTTTQLLANKIMKICSELMNNSLWLSNKLS